MWLRSTSSFVINRSGSGSIGRTILGTLPRWFGIQESVDDYVSVAVASIDGEDVGFLTLVHRSPYASEVYVMAILPGHRRQGIGRRMLKHAEDALGRAGVEFLQVKTLSAEHPDGGYEGTRAFYLADGFRPLEEFPGLWGPTSCLAVDQGCRRAMSWLPGGSVPSLAAC
jgi:GNAT superfamily N-acetyltransferase